MAGRLTGATRSSPACAIQILAENKEVILSQPEFLPSLRQLEMAPDDQDPVRHQARFAARWSLDNMCTVPRMIAWVCCGCTATVN